MTFWKDERSADTVDVFLTVLFAFFFMAVIWGAFAVTYYIFTRIPQ